MKIALDAMGGDHAPSEIIKGAIDALSEKKKDITIILVGQKPAIESELSKYNISDLSIEIVHTDEIIEMHESPSKAFKSKPNSSMCLTLKLQTEKKADASLSAGNTGALMLSSTFILGRLNAVQRPAIMLIIPSLKGPCVFLDGGANVDCKPQHLLQFALMGSSYAQLVLDIPSPKVGLLSVGKEPSKGNELTLSTYPLLEKSGLNFAGNVESSSILTGGIDVVVCDGFVGNIVLKLVEGIATLIKTFDGSKSNENAGKFDYAEYGGAPLLGLNGVCIKAHGSSKAKAIKNAIFAAEKIVRQNVNHKIEEYIQKIS